MKKEIPSIIAIIIMVVISVAAFVCDYTMSQAVSSLVLTISSTFVYALITLVQGNPNIYNMPYKIAAENSQQANIIMVGTIIKIKTLTMILLAAYTILIIFPCTTLTFTLAIAYILLIIFTSITTLKRLKELK